MKRLIALTAAVLLLAGCVPHAELDRIGIAEAVGVDCNDGVYTVTVQFFNTDSSGGVTAIDSSAPNATVARGTGKTVEEALRELSYTSGNSILFGSAAVIVFGEGVLSSLGDSLALAASHYSGNLRAYICAARGSASDIMDVKFSEGNASVEKLEELLENAQQLGLCRPVRMYEAMEKLCGPTGSVALPLLTVTDSGTDTTEDGKGVKIAGGALCTGGKYAGELSVREMSGAHILDPTSERACELVLPYRGYDTRVMLYGIGAEITPSVSGDKPELDVSVSADGKIVSTAIPSPYEAREELERLCERELSERAEALLTKTMTGHGADVTGLAYVIRSVSPGLWETVEQDFRAYLREAEIRVNAQVRMERFGILGSPTGG